MAFKPKSATPGEIRMTQKLSVNLTVRSQADIVSSRTPQTGNASGTKPSVMVTIPHQAQWPLVKLRKTRQDSSTTASPRSRAPIFWKASRPTYLYAGPLGEIVGEVEEGTVILETDRYLDPFNSWWLSTPTIEDGSLAWVSLNHPSSEPQLSPPETTSTWQRVKDDRPASDESSPGMRPHLPVQDPPLAGEEMKGVGVYLAELRRWAAGKVDGVPSDVELIDYYWDVLAMFSTDDVVRHWNFRYQEAIEALLYEPLRKKCDGRGIPSDDLDELWGPARDRLERLLSEFHVAVEGVAVEFIRDIERPQESRCLRRHPVHINVFYYEDLCIRVCTDTPQSSYGGESNAHKAAKNAFQSYEYLSLGAASSLCLLSIPLYALAEFEGYKLLVCAIPPLSSTNCVYAALRGGSCVEKVELLDTLLKRLAMSLNLSPHVVQESARHGDASAISTSVSPSSCSISTSEVTLPVDIELYTGKDRRLYLLNGSRVLPCSFPVSLSLLRESTSCSAHSKEPQPGNALSILWHVAAQRVRAELLLRWPQPVNPDWFVEGACTAQDVERLRELSDFVQTDGISTVAGMLGLMLPVELPLLPVQECRLCGRCLENELRLVVCRHENRCCYICTHCYTVRMLAGLDSLSNWKESNACLSGRGKYEHHNLCMITDHVNFSDAVRCGGVARSADALELVPSIAALTHANGLNLRYLGFVYNRLPQASRPVMGPYLEVEMVSRAAAKLLACRLSRALTPECARAVVEEFLTELLSPSGRAAERFWSEELGPQIGRSFPGIASPFSTATLSVELLLERLCELSGLDLSNESFRSFSRLDSAELGVSAKSYEVLSNTSAKPFIEIKAILPRVKVYRMPLQISLANRERADAAISSVFERLLVFWIGYAPKDSDERLQPNYLSKLDAD
ncbi:unnamed protein product [Phytomonas sp. EM1]|nr:unnamed protein product [Phytomonas sp. EM1]|eukprot:CCW62805.1 unnamed protein product [Phytomonas sp. isolate EM1]